MSALRNYRSLYLIGSLRNERVPAVAAALRHCDFDVFDSWYAAGPEADDYWRKYEIGRGHSYERALRGSAAQHVFNFDKRHLERCDYAVLLMPAGRSGHLELGYFRGFKGREGAIGRTFICLDSTKVPERYDVMYAFADRVFITLDEMCEYLGEL